MTGLTIVSAREHARHHVREKGYVESPRRMDALSRGLCGLKDTASVPVHHFSDKYVEAVHDPAMIRFLKTACERIEEGRLEYPYIFPIRNADKPPADWTLAMGYYCFDTFTPVHKAVWRVAREAVDATLTAAHALRNSSRLAYALVRPPGHHAERGRFGGFCYLNSSAIAANWLATKGTVAMLDLDYHHGNGQQDIFLERDDVLTVSIHAEPRIAYPYFSGYANEVGEGRGKGCNVNLPMPEKLDGTGYRKALKRVIDIIKDYDPAYLVVPLGLDPARDDPTGSWSLVAKDFFENGRMVAALDRPTLFVQEGGYRIGTLAENVRAFFRGVLSV